MIYRLVRALDHITEEGVYDAEVIQFSGSADTPAKNPTVDDYERGLPNPVEYTGNLDDLSWLDYPYTPNRGLLVSKRLVKVLESVKPFPYQLFPARIYSDALAPLLRDSLDFRTDYQVHYPNLYTDDFVILKLTSFTDCIDKDKTIVGGIPFSQTGEEIVDPITEEHYEFVAPEGRFPPVFLPKYTVIYCFSQEAKDACERAGLKGIRFRPIR